MLLWVIIAVVAVATIMVLRSRLRKPNITATVIGNLAVDKRPVELRNDNVTVWQEWVKTRGGVAGYREPGTGNTLMHLAAEGGSSKVMEWAISAGAGINAANTKGDTPLHLAARTGRDEIVQVLLDKGAPVNVVNIDGDTPLIAAAGNSASSGTIILQMLLDHQADPQIADNEGLTPLMAVIVGPHADAAATLLLDHGANIAARSTNMSGLNALDMAASVGKESTVRLLLTRGANVNARNRNGDTAIAGAIRLKRDQNAKVLIDSGLDIHTPNAKGETPLSMAIAHQEDVIAQYLRQHGAQ
jgi:ankyrin repeat protein